MRSWARSAVVVFAMCGAAMLVAPREARANGRFPYANQLVVDPGDASHIVLRTTYGMLQSADAGATWTWFCELSPGYGGQFDPAIAVTKGGTLLVGVTDGLAESTDRGCDFHHGAPLLDEQFVIDVSVWRSDPTQAVALGSTFREAGGVANVIAKSLDDGKTWSALGSPIPPDFTSETLDVAPSDDKRIYVSGFHGTPHVAAVQKSIDGGATWQSFDIPRPVPAVAYIGAIDPTDPDRVYVRLVQEPEGPDANPADKHDVLVVTKDGGKTWTDVYDATENLLGFALSPDGSRVALGGTKDGLRVAGKDDLTFVKTASTVVWCLTWSAAGLYACASVVDDGFTVGLTTDEGKTFTHLYDQTALAPLVCAEGTTTQSNCPAVWPGVACQTLGIGDDELCSTLVTVDARSDGGGERNPVSPGNSSSNGCGCALVGASGASGGALAFGVFLALRMVRRRNRRPSST